MENLPQTLSPDQLRIGNYVQFKQQDHQVVRLLGLHSSLLLRRRFPTEKETYSLDLIDLLTKKYHKDVHLDLVEAIPLTPTLLQRLGFNEQPAGSFPTYQQQVYTWPCDEDTYWVVCFDGDGVSLWLMLDGEEICFSEITSLHHLQNLLFELDDITLRLDCDPASLAATIATQAINDSSPSGE
ncbi:hypothetical protein GO755_04950 [Spirosoma sp. HMF4905]|uniref:Uncharacterized protein n=1 Tax=Spirosoma arboris TaxID=2682092 RepID=A0A7K1S6C0_9BACT|nr:hypothetical protein [Spirosoma arboris]MVM29372.1 hypothetical protein [Spirosoma arboris]